MKRLPGCLKKRAALSKVVLIFLVMFVFLALANKSTQGLNQTLSVCPSQGPIGTMVTIEGTGFDTQAAIMISFGATAVETTYANDGVITAQLSIPSASPGQYVITAMDLASTSLWHNAGLAASATFTVTAGSALTTQTSAPNQFSSTPFQPSIGATASQNPWLSTFTPTVKGSSSFWSPITISIIGAVILAVCLVPSYRLMRRNPKPKMLPEEDPLSHSTYQTPMLSRQDDLVNQSRNQSAFSRQRSSTLAASRYSRSSNCNYTRQSSNTNYRTRYSQRPFCAQQVTSMSSCYNCGKTVRLGQKVCPYCNKRLL